MLSETRKLSKQFSYYYGTGKTIRAVVFCTRNGTNTIHTIINSRFITETNRL
jgi:hypothetical protein